MWLKYFVIKYMIYIFVCNYLEVRSDLTSLTSTTQNLYPSAHK